MPTQWNLPAIANKYNEQDRNQFTRLPVWLAAQSCKKIEYWSRWASLFGTLNWEANMGDLMQGVIAEPSPVTAQVFYPNVLSQPPLKTVVSHFERSNNARVKRHFFESLQFHFLPSFQDFRKKQIGFASQDLDRQVTIANDIFIRSFVLQQSPRVWVVGNTNAAQGSDYIGAPTGDPTNTVQAKNTAWLQQIVNQVGPSGFLDFKTMCAIRDYAENEIGIPAWEGMKSSPKENEVVGGRYILMGEAAIWNALSFDPHILNFKDLNMNLINSRFKGKISDNIVFMQERYPMRIAADGTLPDSEIEMNGLNADQYPGPQLPSGAPQREVVPNPLNVNAPIGVAWLIGDAPYESLKIGPPPEEFASGKVDMKRFAQLNWNGEVRLTDNLLINYGIDASTGLQVIDTNKYGERLQLIADATMGIIGNTPRYCVPIFYRRMNLPSLNQAITV